MNAREVAKDLISAYALRGDDLDQFRKGGLGFYGSDYHASVGGYMWPIDKDAERDEQGRVIGQKIPKTKIIVAEIQGRVVNQLFSLNEIWNEVLQESKHKKLL